MALTEQLDLRSGSVCWPEEAVDYVSPAFPREPVDTAIVGAGIMGAMLAERLTGMGHSVALFDRRPPARGSTAASTALVMWSADTPLTTLAETHGPSQAARRWQRVHVAALELADRVKALGLSCGWAARPEIYLAGDVLDERGLIKEAEARQAAGLPSLFLDAETLGARFDLPPRPGLLCDHSFEVDPVALTTGLLDQAQSRGASLYFPADVVSVAEGPGGVRLTLADGNHVLARNAILATGYEAPRQFLPPAFTLGSSYVIATRPDSPPRWRERAMIWEASDPYLYARATADGRLIVGGADEEFADPVKRDAMLARKQRFLETHGAGLVGGAPLVADCAWSATFGGSPDGLPAIGRVRGFDNLWLTSGFGGNGVTFASLAASLVCAEMSGLPNPDLECFSPYRFG